MTPEIKAKILKELEDQGILEGLDPEQVDELFETLWLQTRAVMIALSEAWQEMVEKIGPIIDAILSGLKPVLDKIKSIERIQGKSAICTKFPHPPRRIDEPRARKNIDHRPQYKARSTI